MRITASVKSSPKAHHVNVATAGAVKSVAAPPKADGAGSSVNGGEFLMLALATCYCNDIYREATRMGIEVSVVEVEAAADFEGIGLAATNVSYKAKIQAAASTEQIAALLTHTDTVAEVQNTVRSGVPVEFVRWRE